MSIKISEVILDIETLMANKPGICRKISSNEAKHHILNVNNLDPFHGEQTRVCCLGAQLKSLTGRPRTSE